MFFYSNKKALLLNGRVNNLEYGSYAPGAAQVFLTDQELPGRWNDPAKRYYLTVEKPRLEAVKRMVGAEKVVEIYNAGGKYLLTNRPL